VHVAILGNGVAGVSAALRIRELQPEWKISLVSGESSYHWSRPALMYIFMGHMRYQETKPFPDSFWDERRIDRVRAWVTRIDTDNRRLECHDGSSVPWDRLLIATGAKSNKFGWPGQDLDGVQGLYGLNDLKNLYRTTADTRHAVIVGGGLIGIELAEMLRSRHIDVTFLVREQSYWDNVLNSEESGLINRLIRHHGIGLELETQLDSIEDDGKGRCSAVVTGDGRRLECQIVGLTAGVSPNVGVAQESGIPTGRGVQVDRTLQTSVKDVWAAGDCAEIVKEGDARNLIQQVWYTGKMQGVVAGENIADAPDGPRNYDPGIWFNSAKFFDLEYQTYGQVNFQISGEQNLYWQESDGRQAARIVHVDGTVIGLQSMGIRWRHEVAESWIRQKRSVDEVIGSLSQLAFDQEFHRRQEPTIARVFREQLS